MLRFDQKFIAQMIEPDSKVIDIGCGEGELLLYLQQNKNSVCHGLEIEPERVSKAVASGLSVIQGNADKDLFDYPDNAFDYAILGMTLQIMQKPKEVLEQACRIADKVVLVIPNFGHYSNRLFLALRGKMPVNSRLSFEWYETPNIHFCTIRDMQDLIRKTGAKVIDQFYISAETAKEFKESSVKANFLGEKGVFLIKK